MPLDRLRKGLFDLADDEPAKRFEVHVFAWAVD
jgi:hypothetical protein